jgi:hypothetical protein
LNEPPSNPIRNPGATGPGGRTQFRADRVRITT